MQCAGTSHALLQLPPGYSQKSSVYLDMTVSRATAPAVRLTAYEALLQTGLGACAEEQGGKGSCEPAPQDGALSATDEAPPCQPTSAHSTQLASTYCCLMESDVGLTLQPVQHCLTQAGDRV